MTARGSSSPRDAGADAARDVLPALPAVELEIVRETLTDDGFLTLRRLTLVTVRDGERSEPFTYDVVERRALDACVIVAHHEEAGATHVWLRSSIRPPPAMRTSAPSTPAGGGLWEVPAGLIDAGERPSAAAARELLEELGFAVPEASLAPLGPWTFPAPGVIGEIHWFFQVEVDPTARRTPEGDGSPLERAAGIVSVPLLDALEACRRGEIRDAKTELALYRLHRSRAAGAH